VGERGETHVAVYGISNPTVRLVHEVAKPNPTTGFSQTRNRFVEADAFRKDLGAAIALGRALDKLHQAGLLLTVQV
jgi:hypothetical protein